MLLTPGDRLGPYEIVEAVGAGGMGEVYRARDPRVGRDVAIKVATERFSQRFEREARAIAALNHPNICTLYDVGSNYLVMELVEGESPTGVPPLAETLRIARQIALALEAAHEKGIVHRDLKPGNIKITPDGVAKVLDFGLAKMLPERDGGILSNRSAELSLSTETMPAAQVSAVMGTLAYMAPEQARGEPVGTRADIWAFGVVLYQLLTGRRPFTGETVSEVLAAVANNEPDWTALPAATPQAIRRLLKRCLEKDPRRRLPDIGVARMEIDEAMAPNVSDAVPAAKNRRAVGWLAGAGAIAAVVIGAIVGVFVWSSRSPGRTVPLPIARFRIPLADDQRPNPSFPGLGLSPDGTQIVYATRHGLYLRKIADLEAKLIAGTDPDSSSESGITASPAFSPDAQSIAFYSSRNTGFNDGAIKKVAASGGTPLTLLRTDYPPFGMSWGADGIIFAHSFGPQRPWGVLRVSPEGGPAQPLVTVDDESIHGPQMLPDGHTLLFTVAAGVGADRWDKARIVVQSLTSSERKVLIEGGRDARYVPTGHIVYARGDVVFAVPFDLSRLQLAGSPVAIADGVGRPGGLQGVSSGVAHFAISSSSLVYLYAPQVVRQGRLAQIDRTGAVRLFRFPAGPYQSPRISPDGARIAVDSDTHDDANIWIGEMAGDSSLRRLTFGGRNRSPTWSADGRRVTFQSDRDGAPGIFWQLADGTGLAERLTTALPGTSHEPESWAPTGDHLLFSVTKGSKVSLWMLSLPDRKAEPFGGVESPLELNATFSRDGRWVVYMTREADKFVVSVQPFPATGAKYQIGGGIYPLWSRDGREISYFHDRGQYSAVEVLQRPGFAVGPPSDLFLQPATKVYMAGAVPRGGLDTTPDGKFVALVAESQEAFAPPAQLQVVLNWTAELK